MDDNAVYSKEIEEKSIDFVSALLLFPFVEKPLSSNIKGLPIIRRISNYTLGSSTTLKYTHI